MFVKTSFTLIILFTIAYIQITHQNCSSINEKIQRSIIRGNYQNVLNQNQGNLIQSKNVIWFGGSIVGNFLRNAIYKVDGEIGFLFCSIGYSLKVDLLQKYELNTVKIWLWNGDYRFYNIKVFIKLENTETKIYDSNQAQSIVTIKFPNQLVQSLRIYNTAGNTKDGGLQVIKVEAYDKFQ
ncbi:unnamed protein product [Paramecium pentaurelia]|uniref:Uncharacterized protein n=1 Tax=Paramecium pentaurelia TaxID=43138 RepID=A0A8S1XUT6_9CILI|nr:unnamed protein product [Paramecium pentaurelia]